MNQRKKKLLLWWYDKTGQWGKYLFLYRGYTEWMEATFSDK